jgi:protein gp37
MGDTKIEWTRNADGTAGKTWNPIRARNLETGEVGWFCEHMSSGCDNCYAEKMNVNTYFGNGLPYKATSRQHLELFLDEQMLLQPLRWRKPTNIFPCSMTDLFGRFVKDEWRDRIFAVMALAHWHTFQTLTKRANGMSKYLSGGTDRITAIWDQMGRGYPVPFQAVEKSPNHDPHWPFKKGLQGYFANPPWPLVNVWLGVSVEDQQTADERIPLLLQTPAAVRWISAEPLLGPIDLRRIDYSNLLRDTLRDFVRHTAERKSEDVEAAVTDAAASIPDPQTLEPSERPYLNVVTGAWFDGWDSGSDGKRIDWVVVGGESGPGARPMHPDWARSLRDQCVAACVPFFFKQWGEYAPAFQIPGEGSTSRSLIHTFSDGKKTQRFGKKVSGRELDGREWSEYPKAKEVAA